TFFVYGIFIGAAAATRRNDHLYLSAITETMTGGLRLAVETIDRVVVLAVALCMVYYGYINFLQGFGSFRMPSMTPIASLYAAIPDRKSTRLNSSHRTISYAVFCLKKKI